MIIFGLFKPNVEKMEKKKDIDGLVEASKHNDQAVRIKAVAALGRVGDGRAVEPLTQALKDKDIDLRSGAADALQKLGWKPRDDTERAHHLIAEEKWDELPGLGRPAVEPLIKSLHDEDKGVRARAASTLTKIGDPRAIHHLIQALKDEDSGVRLSVGFGLQKMGATAVEPLIEALKDESPRVRSGAANALGHMALGGAKHERAVHPLIEVLKDEDKGVRESAVWALGMIGDARAVEPILEVMKGARYLVVVTEAAKAIARIGDTGLLMLDEPFGGLKPGPVTVLDVAIECVTQLMKVQDPTPITMAVMTLKDIGEPAVEPLIQTLKDETRHVQLRWGAAMALGDIGDERAVEPLTQALRYQNQDIERAAKEALQKIRGKRS